MAIKQQEKNFLIGIAAFGLALAATIFVLPMLSSGAKSSSEPPPAAPRAERVRVEVQPVAPPAAPGLPRPAKEPPPRPRERAEKAPAAPAGEAVMVLAKPQSLSPAFFEDGSGTVELPPVVERYLDSVRNGSRFMGRLESIALRDKRALEEQRQSGEASQPLQLVRGDHTKVISYNMKIKTPYLSASFDAGAIDDFKGDVLVEWVDSASGERIELFFTPLAREGAQGHFRLDMPEQLAPPASTVYVYSATADMPLIASGGYQP